MKRLAIAALLIATQLAAQPEKLQSVEPDDAISFEQTINVSSEETNCTKFRGAKRKQCMACLSPNFLLKNLMNFSAHERATYFDSLTEAEHEELLANFTPETWETLYANLTGGEQVNFEQTLEQQRKKWIDEPRAQREAERQLALEEQHRSDKKIQYLLVGGAVVVVGILAIINPPAAVTVAAKVATLTALGNGGSIGSYDENRT